MTQEALKQLNLALETMEAACKRIDELVAENKVLKEALAKEKALQALHNENERLGLYKDAYAQPEQKPVAWKLMPRDATDSMLKAMDECSTEGYDERLYAGHAASVYMAAWDAAPITPAEQGPTGCACRWDSEGDRVVTCARHEGWLEVIAEWADRAREAEKKLKALAHPVFHAIIAGALFDFMGWLTSRKERIVLSSADEASPAVDAIRDFAKMRGLSLDDARVQDWNTSPPQRTEQEPVAWRTFDGEGGYDYRSYENNESYADEWDKRNPNHKGWVDKLYTTPPPCPTCEALARTVMMDQTGRDA